MGNLQKMLTMQKDFQDKLNTFPILHNEDETADFIRKNILYTVDELSEMCREIPRYKGWKSYVGFDRVLHLGLAREEYIDAFHFFMNIGLALGMTEDMIFDEYCKKNGINYQRQEEGYGFNDDTFHTLNEIKKIQFVAENIAYAEALADTLGTTLEEQLCKLYESSKVVK